MNTAISIRLLLADDHAIVRAGYRHLLQKQKGCEVVAEAESAEQAYVLFKLHDPDVLITDVAMPGASGLEVIQRVIRLRSDARILVFSMHVSVDFASAALRAGALGYVTKSSAPDVLLRAIPEVYARRRFLSPDVAQVIAIARDPERRRPLEALTPREFDVLRLLVAPATVPEIAARLHLSEKTVRNLHYQIKSKLGVSGDVELTRLAISLGLAG